MFEKPSLRNLTNLNYGQIAKDQNPILHQLGVPHVNSFNFMTEKGLEIAVKDLETLEFFINSDRLAIQIIKANISHPCVPFGTLCCNSAIYPEECRQKAGTYRGKLMITFAWWLNGKQQESIDKDLGDIPIMIKSNRCHLEKLSPKGLVSHNEHEDEWGGYFLIKGHEKIVRMLVLDRKHYPILIKRFGWKSRGRLFTDIGVSIRCVKEDHTDRTNVLHFLMDGTAKLMFSHKRVLFYVPLMLILKCLSNSTDYYIYQQLMKGCEEDPYYIGCLKTMLTALHKQKLHTTEDCKNNLAEIFKKKCHELPEWFTEEDTASYVLKHHILIHLPNYEDKFNMIVFMTQKLFSFVQDKCKNEGTDAVMMQELLLGGHLYLKVLKERLQNWLNNVKSCLTTRANMSFQFKITQDEVVKSVNFVRRLDNIMEKILATGNIFSRSGLGLMQYNGFTVVAENINRIRYMSHFRAVHRGSFFLELRTTEPRQLLPDAWGFICPVQTPDGAPCGLLNHLTSMCFISEEPDEKKLQNIPLALIELGMIPMKNIADSYNWKEFTMVQLDGRIIGYIRDNSIVNVVDKLRILKIKGVEVPNTMEIVLVPKKEAAKQYPGLFLFTGPARMLRPVLNLVTRQIEYIGTFEQVYLHISVTTEEIYRGVTTHLEISNTSFMSNLAQLIPMPDFNQSPRNMYQCQMGKQTMGTPCHNWMVQTETKLYRLLTPTSPLFRPAFYDELGLDDFAMGTNAIVAVISYTGFDMEDAMIINKASYDRGFAHGSVIKSQFIRLDDEDNYFCRDPSQEGLIAHLDTDGLPFIGKRMQPGDPLYCFYNSDEDRYNVKMYSAMEECTVESVKRCGYFDPTVALKLVCITFRLSRNPSVGDKFASRAGQKGICSAKWATEDLPFTESGLVPDIIFNPHGFPSRMTIAMMIEVMAGKSAALHGLVHDASPFKFTEEYTPIDYFGKLLEAGGYSYYGTESMYSGIYGREITAQIFFGVVYYQRLRHMVSDKWQVRSTGVMDIITQQPLKGKHKAGGVRFGEMEKDSMFSHGASFLLQERLLDCSDLQTILICTSCKTFLGPFTLVTRRSDKKQQIETKEQCRLCRHGKNIEEIEIPYILKFFITQIASCNINVKIDTQTV